jgi:hypothetical protein
MDIRLHRDYLRGVLKIEEMWTMAQKRSKTNSIGWTPAARRSAMSGLELYQPPFPEQHFGARYLHDELWR